MTTPQPFVPARLTNLYVRNFLANFAGNCIIIMLNLFTPLAVYENWKVFLWQSGWNSGWIVIPMALFLVVWTVIGLQYLIQRPISTGLRRLQSGGKLPPDLLEKAKRRLVNLPSILGLTNLILWVILTCLFMPIMYFIVDMTIPSFFYGFFRFIMIGLISSFLSFFLIDEYCRGKLIPIFFPKGRLADLPGTIKISILRRIRVLFGAGTNAPLILLVGTIGFAVWEVQDYAISAGQFGKQVFAFAVAVYFLFVSISLALNFLAGRSILFPVKEMMRIVDKVRDGDFNQKVRVVSNDELGNLGDGMNEMTEGLVERDRMRRSLNLAKEVQQTLLPRTDPELKGLDIASTSVYCDETGGDYYDFLGADGDNAGKIGVVLGDVSGHGISSALLMATARALLRQRSALPGSTSQIVSDINRQLTRDIEETGGFMTLFYLTVDVEKRKLNWVRAGHDPAIFYDPVTDTFEELQGTGMALGVSTDARFEESEKRRLTDDNIIFLGTDGIWEARNPRDEMFGKEPIYRIIRRNPSASAKEILTGVLDAFNGFLEDRAPEDDVTIIVIKIASNQYD
jgi:sigma-B regulation protein RsbU (phosphoserine phosphatase)